VGIAGQAHRAEGKALCLSNKKILMLYRLHEAHFRLRVVPAALQFATVASALMCGTGLTSQFVNLRLVLEPLKAIIGFLPLNLCNYAAEKAPFSFPMETIYHEAFVSVHSMLDTPLLWRILLGCHCIHSQQADGHVNDLATSCS